MTTITTPFRKTEVKIHYDMRALIRCECNAYSQYIQPLAALVLAEEFQQLAESHFKMKGWIMGSMLPICPSCVIQKEQGALNA